MSCPMTTCMCHTPPAADDARASGLIRKAWRAYWDWRARRVTVMLLSSLDARTLRDIGISPGEIEALVNCSQGRRRRYDASWLWRCGGG
jgi:uncharacterized protein YjiS (DUF1127 family)